MRESRKAILLEQVAPWILVHVLTPAAIITMMTAFLNFLLELRALLQLPGNLTLKVIGFFFVSATVLIERYGRRYQERGRQRLYLGTLALMTSFSMSFFTASAGSIFGGITAGGRLALNMAIVGLVWAMCTVLTRRLGLDMYFQRPSQPVAPPLYFPGMVGSGMDASPQALDGLPATDWAARREEGDPIKREWGVKKEEMDPHGTAGRVNKREMGPSGADVGVKNEQAQPQTPFAILKEMAQETLRGALAIYPALQASPGLKRHLDLLLEGMRTLWRPIRLVFGADPEGDPNPARPVFRLVLFGMVIFAMGEPLILAADPALGADALVLMMVFLFSAGLLMALGSAASALVRAEARGSTANMSLLSIRVGAGAVVLALALTAALGAPGVRFEGRGSLHANRSMVPQRSDQGPSQSQPDGPAEEGAGKRSEGQGAGSGTGDSPSGPSTGGMALLNALAGLGTKLMGLLGLLGLVAFGIATLRSPERFKRWLRFFRAAILGASSRLSRWLAVLKAGRRSARGLEDVPLRRLEKMRQLPPAAAIRHAYGLALEVSARAGRPRAPRLTPHEFLKALPLPLRRVRSEVESLTELYVRAAYSAEPVGEGDKKEALYLAEQIARQVLPVGAGSGGPRS